MSKFHFTPEPQPRDSYEQPQFQVDGAPRKPLPQGTWVPFHNLDPATTVEDIQNLICNRTGIVVPLTSIVIKPFSPRSSGAIVALGKKETRDLLAWALSEDTLFGRPLDIAPAMERKDSLR